MIRQLRVLELGSYVAPAYAGMILAEQGAQVTKWTRHDPIQTLHGGAELWSWINHGKTITDTEARQVTDIRPGQFHVILDNFRARTWRQWGISPQELAHHLGAVWVSLRADDDARSFDAIAQARAWGDKGHLPFYIGDTAAGLWLAFKALSAPPGHHVIRQAACLAKLVEGELIAPHRQWDDPGTWLWATPDQPARVVFRDLVVSEPVRDDRWRWAHLDHVGGRYVI